MLARRIIIFAVFCIVFLTSMVPRLNSVLFFTLFNGHLTSAAHCPSKYPLHINYAVPEKCALSNKHSGNLKPVIIIIGHFCTGPF